MTLNTGVAADIPRVDKALKIAYADNMAEVLPAEFSMIANDLRLIPKEKGPGNKYYQAVKTSRSGGATYSSSGQVVTLNQGIAPGFTNAELNGSTITLRELIPYEVINRAAKGKQAFIDGMGEFVTSLGEGGAFRRELALMYGGGTGANPTGALGKMLAKTGSSGTTLRFQFDDETWCASMWIGQTDSEYDIYSSDGTTKRNTNGSERTAVYVATAVIDAVNRIVEFTTDANNVTAAQVGDIIKFAGSHGTDMVGIKTSFSVATLFNIATTNLFWKPQTYTVGGQLTFMHLMNGCQQLFELGFLGELIMYASARAFKQLQDDQAAFVSHANSGSGQGGSKLNVGWDGDSITFHSPCGKVTIKKHILMQQGISFALPKGKAMRIGSSDLTFSQPHIGRMLIDHPDKNAVQLKIWSDQAYYIERPNASLLFTGITA